MAAPKTTIWPLEPHTRAKHEILRRYLYAWTPILLHGGFPQIAYIDGFAGPGQYVSGEDGSPIIALRAALTHRANIQGRILFLFIEKDVERANFLQGLIDGLELPETFRVKVEGGKSFEEAFDAFRSFYLDKGRRFPPAFAFIDPFGWAGVPFSVIAFIMGRPNCEVFITFMFEEINRFLGHPDQGRNFDIFFGTDEWRQGVALGSPQARNKFLHDLYLRQLKAKAHARYVRSFQMRNSSNVTDYYLFYATNNLLGLKKMKEAMWKVDESGEFIFSDATDPDQIVLFSAQPNFAHLKVQILRRFSPGTTTVGQLEEFILAETAFRETHYKIQVLKPLELEEPPQLTVFNAPLNRRRGTFGSPTMGLRFL